MWVSLCLLAGGLVAWWLAPHTQTTVRRIGLAYEVLGVAVVIVEMARAMKKHGVAWPHVRLLRFIRDTPIFQRVVSGSVEIALSGVSATGMVGQPVVAVVSQSLEQRVDSLERRVTSLDDRLGKLDSRIGKEEGARAAAVAAEANTREQGDKHLREAIKAIEVGSLELSLLGILWLLVGMVLTTGTQEVCAWFLSCAG